MDLIRQGTRAFFGGARRGSTALTGLGAALLAIGWVRRLARPKRELLYSRDLRKGDSLRIRLLGAGDPAEGEDLTVRVGDS
ncbi:MAG TPA: hypothetical protein VLL51_01455 [Gemmatimonadales bacterium]|nr:hypothetical protein [Gemmatimonadales bacterium]